MITDLVYASLRKTPILLQYLSLFSDVLVYGGVIGFYLFWLFTSVKTKKINWIFFLELSLGLFVGFTLAEWVKITFPEIRPISYYLPAETLAQAGLPAQPYFDSFPSRHTLVASILGFLILPHHFELGAGFVFISILVGLLRWLSLNHWPIDVLVGWLLGMLIAIFVNELTKFLLRLKNKRT